MSALADGGTGAATSIAVGAAGPAEIASAVGSIASGSTGASATTSGDGAGAGIAAADFGRALGFGGEWVATGFGGGGSSVIVASSGGASGARVKSTGQSESPTWTAIDIAKAITKTGRTDQRGRAPASTAAVAITASACSVEKVVFT